MNKITTSMAILISGILIALVIAFKDNRPKYSFENITEKSTYLRLNNQTGEVCIGTIDSKDHKKLKKDYPTVKICE